MFLGMFLEMFPKKNHNSLQLSLSLSLSLCLSSFLSLSLSLSASRRSKLKTSRSTRCAHLIFGNVSSFSPPFLVSYGKKMPSAIKIKKDILKSLDMLKKFHSSLRALKKHILIKNYFSRFSKKWKKIAKDPAEKSPISTSSIDI